MLYPLFRRFRPRRHFRRFEELASGMREAARMDNSIVIFQRAVIPDVPVGLQAPAVPAEDPLRVFRRPCLPVLV